jgi:hypothetical protein
MDRTMDQRHQQCGRDSLPGYVTEDKRCPIAADAENVAEIAANVSGRYALRREFKMRRFEVTRWKQIRLNLTR